MIDARWLGLRKFSEVDEFQRGQVTGLRGSRDILILGMELEPVVTLGVRAVASQDLLDSQQKLQDRGIEICATDRGGQATLHVPGQLVIYPMLDLKKWDLGIKNFVGQLMKVTQRVLAGYGISAFYDAGSPGLYTILGKLVFCGLKVDRGVIRHGLSVNISNDLAAFGWIRSCGTQGPRLDRVKNHHDVGLEAFFETWVREFQEHFFQEIPVDFPLSESEALDKTKLIQPMSSVSVVGSARP